MDFNILTRFHWLKLSNEQRFLLRNEFSIPKSEGVVMLGGILHSDGTSEKDLSVITISSMQNFLGPDVTTQNFAELFNLVLEKINNAIEQEKQERENDKVKEEKEKKVQEMAEVMDNIMTMIDNLPLDARVLLVSNYKNLISPKKEQTNVTETKGPEKIEERSNQPRTKATRGRNSAPEKVS